MALCEERSDTLGAPAGCAAWNIEENEMGNRRVDWHEWSEAWPDLKDAGRRVEVEREDGATISGELTVYFCHDGECGEFPVFAVIDDVGTTHIITDNEYWRFLP